MKESKVSSTGVVMLRSEGWSLGVDVPGTLPRLEGALPREERVLEPLEFHDLPDLLAQRQRLTLPASG